MIAISTPAADRGLLTIEQLREAAGVPQSDTSQDTKLEKLGLQVADLICRECGIAGDGIRPPTLRKETVVETFRLNHCRPMLVLSRRFVPNVIAVVLRGEALESSDHEVDAEGGILKRIMAGMEISWPMGTVAVTYEAGFDEVPTDLALAAMSAVREQLSSTDRDPLLKRERVEGVSELEYWVGGFGTSTGSAFSSTVQAMLDPYRSAWFE
ncbi:hypothetical protein [Ancylobacter defluvii]|uniref:Uncharacterized protein n=1 Tax=Ancylobacter defluvii TaxID=1282440 RepID=A0A9W6NDI5_9HYPH|nr:hypothetical protein [Ancylobacter defluvii]MBS7588286.1 hypothetical protein [Ancylobacter defluvii]GLK86682.1 hypothetical protein GCM10017653_47520 [Ancylobacter defluvii]